MRLKDILNSAVSQPGSVPDRTYKVLQRYENGAELLDEHRPFVGNFLSENTGYFKDDEGVLRETAHLSVDGRYLLSTDRIKRNKIYRFIHGLLHGV